MKIIDEAGNEVLSPDLELGYLKPDVIITHHEATPARQEVAELVELKRDKKNPADKLLGKRIVQPFAPGRPAWDEKVPIQRYILYTPEELAERERQREEVEAVEAEAAAKQARMDALPGEVDDLNEAVAEAGVMIADNNLSNDELMEAVAELGAMVAELTTKEVSNG